MRKYLNYNVYAIFIMQLFFTSSCEINNKNEGSGNVITQRRAVQSFDKINVDGILTVYIEQDEFYKVEVRTDDNLQYIVNIENENNELIVSTNPNEEFDASKMDVFITCPDIKEIVLYGVNALYCKERLILNATDIEKKNTGFMQFNAVLDELNIDTDGVGDLELIGKSQDLTIVNDMVGNIDAFEFKAFNVYLTNSGTGTVEIYASNLLDVDLFGVGDVYCKGNPQRIIKNSDGIGRLYIVE